MCSIGGRRRNCGSNRWITYQVVYDVHAEVTVFYAPMFRDEIGFITMPTEVNRIAFDPSQMSANEAVRHAVCEFIDTTPLPAGTPRDPNWRPPIGRGGARLF